jgi:hypothetical protein
MSVQPGTPLPWEWGEGGRLLHDVRGSHSSTVLMIHDRMWRPLKQDAAYIVTACNSFPELVAALQKARDKFRHYEDLHRIKCTAEGDEKADRNRELADEMEAALSKALSALEVGGGNRG